MRVTRGDNDDSTSRPTGFAWARALCLAALGLAPYAQANTSNGYNLPLGVTSLSRDIYALHMEVFWICVGIAVVVFGVMIYALVKFRRSQGAKPDTTLLHSTTVEIVWTVIPVVILVVMAIPAAKVILMMEDTRNSELSIRVTGYQWKWEYQYMDAGEGIDFFSTLARDSNFARQLHSGIDPKTVPNYLLEVDKPLVIPSGTKVRLLLTSQDVIHAWWVPDFGAKRSAIPGFVNELWFRVDPGREGIYRGQCAALCGRDHGFMPIVVDVRTPDDFKKWVLDQKAALKQAAAPGASAAQLAQRCVSEADTALAVQGDFAEALALRAACLATPLDANGSQTAHAAHRAARDIGMALQLAGRNPRVLLLDAMSDYQLAPRLGGNKERALVKLRQAVAAFEVERAGTEHLPGWGAAEAYLLLARDLLDHGEPVAARDALEHALLLAPEFAQARRLMAQITSG